MRVTVLGNAGRYLAPLSGGSSYLVEHEGARILLDAGQGAREALSRLGVDRLDVLFISHFHYDHCVDLPTLAALVGDRTPVLVPRGERPRLDALARGYAWAGPWEVGEVREVEAGEALTLGGLSWRFARTQHSAPSLAVRLDAPGGGSFVYASDTAACAPLRDLAQGADLLLMHALLPDVDPASDHAARHATARSAGALARDAGVRALALSHRFHLSDDAEMLAAARATFPATALARDGETLVLGG